MPPKILDSLLNFVFNMAAISSMNLSSPSSGTITSLPPYTLNFRFSPLKVFHLWASLRLLTVRSGVCPEEFQWRTPVKPASHFSPHDWAGNHLPFSMTCEEYFCLSQEGRWGSATPNAVIKGHLVFHLDDFLLLKRFVMSFCLEKQFLELRSQEKFIA